MADKVKIALLGPSAPYRGGIVHFNSRLGLELSGTKNVELQLFFWKRLYPTILLPKSEKEFQDQESKENFLTEGEAIIDYMNPISWVHLVLKIRRNDTDIFLTHWTQPIHFPVLMTLFLFLKLFNSTKIYLIAHNIEQHETSLLNKFLTKLILQVSDKIIVHAETEASKAQKLVESKKIIFGFLPLFNFFPTDKNFDLKKFKRKLKLRKRVILFFGFIRPYKGLEYLIEAFHDLKEEDVSLLIVGENFWKSNEKFSFFERLRRLPFKMLKYLTLKDSVENYNPLELIEKYSLQENCVVVNKYVSNEDVFKYFKIADVLVAPYISASQSALVQLAYAFDLPVIASKVGGLSEVVEDGVSGYLTIPKNSKDITKKIRLILKDNRVTSKKVSIYKKRFNWVKYIDLIRNNNIEEIKRNHNKKKFFVKILGFFFYLLVFFFFFNYFNKIDFSKLLKIKINYYYIFLAIFINLASRFYNSFIWIKILHYLGAKNLPYLQLNYVFSKASLGRYVPGKVTWIAGRVFFAMKYGIPKRKLAVSSVFEGALTVLLGFLVGGIFLFFTDSINVIDQKLRIFFLFIIISTAFGLLPPVFNFFLRKAYRFLKKNELQKEDQISAKILIGTSILFTFRLILDGISAFFMILAVFPELSFKSIPLVIGTINIAGSAGIASLFAPSGLGVREGIEILLLGGVLPKEIILAAVVLMRVLLTFIDLFYFFLSFGLLKIKNNVINTI